MKNVRRQVQQLVPIVICLCYGVGDGHSVNTKNTITKYQILIHHEVLYGKELTASGFIFQHDSDGKHTASSMNACPNYQSWIGLRSARSSTLLKHFGIIVKVNRTKSKTH